MNPHHRMLGPPEQMPPHYNPHHGGNLPPHPHMYKMMPPHHGMDPSGMMVPHPGGPPRSSKGLPPPLPSSDPMQQHPHLPPHYMKMHNMDPLLGGPPPPGHQQQHMRFMPMMDEGFGMGPPPSHHPHPPHMHPHMHPHGQMHPHPMHPNDGRPPPQSINNTYVSTTMSIQQLNIQNLGPGGPPSDLQPGTIHYHASSANGPDSQQQQQGLSASNGNGTMFASQQQFTALSNMPTNDPGFGPPFNDLQMPPSNLSVEGVQPPGYW